MKLRDKTLRHPLALALILGISSSFVIGYNWNDIGTPIGEASQVKYVYWAFALAGLICATLGVLFLKGTIYYLLSTFLAFVIATPFLFAAIYRNLQIATGGKCVNGLNFLGDELYFSFSTFTTLGYGDMHPLGFCRALSSIEATIGYLTLGAFLALAIRPR